MKKEPALTWAAAVVSLLLMAVYVVLIAVLWPPGLLIGVLLGLLIFLPAISFVIRISRQQNRGLSLGLSATDIIEMSDAELASHRQQTLTDLERRLEIRELRFARRVRASERSGLDYVDILEVDPSDEELGTLVVKDLELVALIEEESRLAFNRILENRYAAGEGVNTPLILSDIKEFIEKVAGLYRPESNDILLQTDIELIAKSLSSASLHLLMIVDDMPLNLKTYNTAKVYRTIRRGASYYGTYKSVRPYVEHGLNAVQVARLALGMNPLAVGALWLAGKLTTHGAKAVGERLLQQKALQLLGNFIRVIGFEAAMMYGGGFRHRDANWVLGAELVNLEVSRGADHAGRDAALEKLCSVVLRNEFDRIHLITSMSKRKMLDVSPMRPQIVMTLLERKNAAEVLTKHCRDTDVDLSDRLIIRWREAVETTLGVHLDLGVRSFSEVNKGRFWSRIKNRLSFRRDKAKTDSNVRPSDE